MYVQEIPNYSVLYIGDSEYDFGQIRHKFNAVESFSCDLEWVSSVEDGLELLAKNKFDVYFVDYKLSLINGVELFKRSRSLGGKNPVILLMDNYDENSVIKPLKLGFDDYIIKSEINPNFLRRSVRYAVDRNKNLEKIRSAEKETLTAKRVAEEASKIKSEFIINLSNELKIPLNTMKETSAFFKEIVAGEDQKNYFHTLENVQDDLCEIIDNISVFSDIEAKIFKINFEEFSLHQVINEVNMYYFPKLSQKGIKIDFEISDQINEKIYGDYEKLIQVLHYLIDNAIDLTLKGEIHLGIEIFSKDKDTILFTVSDTGIGIPKDRISNIFNSFEQRQEETGSKKFGSGLGLTLSKRIIELLGGKIWVQSIEGQGSCFYFTLPIKFEMLNNKSISSDHSIENNDSNNCKRILLADDTEDMRNLVEIYLSLMS